MGNTTDSAKANSVKLPRPNKVIAVPTPSSLDFFKWWCVFLRPIIYLTDREIDVISSFLKQRWELSKCISDPVVLDTMTMSDDIKRKVMDECHITLQHFYVVMSALRKKQIIRGNIIDPRMIPPIRETDNGVFQLLILFKGIGQNNQSSD